MNENIQKVVKCVSCNKFFGYAENNKSCPFCNTMYSEDDKKIADSKDAPAHTSWKKVPVKTQKDSFRIWKRD